MNSNTIRSCSSVSLFSLSMVIPNMFASYISMR